MNDERRAALDAASSAFRSFIDREQVEDSRPEAPADGDAEAGGFNELRRTVRRTLDLYLELTERFFEASTRSFESTLRERGVKVNGDQRDGDTATLRVVAAAGERCSTPIWTHNRSDAPIVDATYRATDLSSHRGGRIAATSISVDPPVISRLSAGATVSARVTVEVGPDVVPGVYVGHVLLSPVDDAGCPIRVEVIR